MKEYSLLLEQPLIREENDKFEKLAQRFRMGKIKQNKRGDDLMMVGRVNENGVVFVTRPACEKCGCTFATKRGVKHHQKTTQKCGIIVDRIANGVPVPVVEAPVVEAPVVEAPSPVVDDEKKIIIIRKKLIKKKKLIIVKKPEIEIEKIEMD